ncbi:MAG: hypothetical protein ACLSAF_02650 [Intestinimonas sp.]
MRAYVEEQLDRARTAGVRRGRLCGVGGTIRALNKLSVDVFHKPPGEPFHDGGRAT